MLIGAYYDLCAVSLIMLRVTTQYTVQLILVMPLTFQLSDLPKYFTNKK